MQSGESFRDALLNFTQKGGLIFGICNGFQILVSLGLLPGASTHSDATVSLTQNINGLFMDRWILCEFNSNNPMKSMWPSQTLYLPIRHGEGRLIVRNENVADELREKKLIAMSYFGENPNGSFESCAALSDESGRILGMMPHPEAFLSKYNHPEWAHLNTNDEKGQGLKFFEKLVQYAGE
jgi:phosphoribosylformylglycinamidine synthase